MISHLFFPGKYCLHEGLVSSIHIFFSLMGVGVWIKESLYCLLIHTRIKIRLQFTKINYIFLDTEFAFTFFLYCHNTFLNKFRDFPLFSLTKLFQMSSKNSICNPNLRLVSILNKCWLEIHVHYRYINFFFLNKTESGDVHTVGTLTTWTRQLWMGEKNLRCLRIPDKNSKLW